MNKLKKEEPRIISILNSLYAECEKSLQYFTSTMNYYRVKYEELRQKL